MDYDVKSGSPEKQRTACVVAGVFDGRRLSAAARELDSASDDYLSGLLRRGDLEGKPGQTLLLHGVPNLLCDRVLLVGCGREREFDLNAYRQAVAVAARTLNETGSTEAVNYLTDLNVKGHDTYSRVRQCVEVTETTLYRFDQLKTKAEKLRRPLKSMTLAVPTRRDLRDGDAAIAHGRALGAGMNLARNLGNLPGNICTPGFLAEQAQALGKSYRQLKVNVLEEADMEKLGMGALLSVARGSRQPAKLLVMEYKGGDKTEAPICLVGKGVTFDSGGISIKPGAGMDEMKFDMCGAASVIGTLRAVCELALPLNLVVLVPTSENLPDGQASKPGDIVTSMSGQTIEILNTDAEGRLLLCDALSYAERYEPEAVIDVATLTGACVIALGNHAAAVLGNHSPLINDLLSAGRFAHDRCWEMPLWDEYQQQLDSNFADMANIGGREAGTVTAACFLSRFARKYHWAHLDIAGVAWKQGKEKGATGRPVPLLLQYLLDRCGQGRGNA